LSYLATHHLPQLPDVDRWVKHKAESTLAPMLPQPANPLSP
jgi:hypothetical protein